MILPTISDMLLIEIVSHPCFEINCSAPKVKKSLCETIRQFSRFSVTEDLDSWVHKIATSLVKKFKKLRKNKESFIKHEFEYLKRCELRGVWEEVSSSPQVSCY